MNSTITIPEGMPVLSRGAHRDQHSGACFMEYTSVLAGLPFSDHPRCTDLGLSRVMQAANDALSDRERQKLVPLLGRAIGLVGRDGFMDHDFHRRVQARVAREWEMVFPAMDMPDSFCRAFAAWLKAQGWPDGTSGNSGILRAARLDGPAADELIKRVIRLHEIYEETMRDFGMTREWIKPEERLYSDLSEMGAYSKDLYKFNALFPSTKEIESLLSVPA